MLDDYLSKDIFSNAFTQEERHVLQNARNILNTKLKKRSLIGSWDMLIDYLRVDLGPRRAEALRVLYLDTKNGLIEDRLHSTGSPTHTPVYPSEIARHGLLIDASSIILSHNHPSGDPTPSRDDIKMTDTIITACRTLEITVHDHVIIGLGSEPGFLSMRSVGHIK